MVSTIESPKAAITYIFLFGEGCGLTEGFSFGVKLGVSTAAFVATVVFGVTTELVEGVRITFDSPNVSFVVSELRTVFLEIKNAREKITTPPNIRIDKIADIIHPLPDIKKFNPLR